MNSSSRRGRSVASSSSSSRSCGVWTRSMPGVRISAARALQRVRDQVLGRIAVGPVEQLLGLLEREAEPDQALARQQPRVVTARDPDRVVGGRRADLLAQLDDDPLGGALADPRHGLEPRGVAGGDGGEQLARRAAREHRQRQLRPDRLHSDQHQEEVALRLGGEAVERERVVADDQVRVQGRVLADRRRVAQRLGRDRQPVADAAAGDDDVVACAAPRPRRRGARSCGAADRRAQGGAVGVADRDGQRVGRVVGRRQARSARAGAGPSAAPGLLGAARAADGALDLLRRVGRARQPALAGREDDDAARLADGEGGAGVRAEVEVLDGQRLGRVASRSARRRGRG